MRPKSREEEKHLALLKAPVEATKNYNPAGPLEEEVSHNLDR
jgi:hypothetical protein